MEQLFNRDGTEFNGTPEFNDAGKPVRYVPVACDRCHVINGQRLWVMGTENGRPYSRTGFDCWTCGNSGVRGQRKERLYTATELARVNKSAKTREARKAEAHRIAMEQAEVARAAKEAEFRAQNAEFLNKLDGLDGDYWVGFRQSFYARAEAPTARQIELVEGEVAKRQKNASSAFVGVVGLWETMILTVERIISLPDNGFGVSYINLLRDGGNNLIVYKGLSDLGAVGETATVKAKIKEHFVRDGVNQTVIQRPRVLP